jgi:hypothetical protein
MWDAAASKQSPLVSGPFHDWLLQECSTALNEEHWLWYIRHEIEMSHCNGNRFDAQFSCVPANRKQAGAANYRLGE